MRKQGTNTLGIQFEDKQIAALRAIATAERISVGGLVRDAVDLYLEKRRLQAEENRRRAEMNIQTADKVLRELEDSLKHETPEKRRAMIDEVRKVFEPHRRIAEKVRLNPPSDRPADLGGEDPKDKKV